MLRNLRKSRAFTIKKVSTDLNISESFLSQIETGYRKPSNELIDLIANYYSLDREIVQLVTGTIPDWFKIALINKPEAALKAAKDKFKLYDK
jgi:transcriptional regulator with XRE-family HTH domain